MSIIVNLDLIMEKKEMSSTELSAKLGITMSNLSILRKNKAKAVRISILNNLCNILQCQPSDLLEYKQEYK